MEESLRGSPSYNDLAARIETNEGADPSRQAIALRLGKPFEDLVKTLLGHVISLKVDQDIEAGKFSSMNFRDYQRVLVQDSTVIKLPAALFSEFSGVSNGHSTVCNARIQAVYDLISGKLIQFSIDSYSKNDLAAAPELEIMKGDLVLRDRGYLTAGEIQRHIESGADFIYRHKTGIIYLDPETQLAVDLPALLKDCGNLDIEVLMNNPQRTRVRLLSAPVDPETANLRRMKAKKESKGQNPGNKRLRGGVGQILLLRQTEGAFAFHRNMGGFGLT